MARPSKRVQRRANLQCNNPKCKHLFVGLAWFVSIESSDMRTIGWNLDREGARGNRCPQCGSQVIRVLDD
jgi:hypothetical protein